MRIDLERQLDNLKKRQYIFWFDDSRRTLWLDEFNLLSKKTARHKYEIAQQYKRIPTRSDLHNLSKEEVPLDEEIKEAAIKSLISQIKVDFWSKD